jgi:hypothetical protein
MAGASLSLAATWFLRGWLISPTYRAALIAGVMLGLLQLTKATYLIYYALWPLLWLATEFTRAPVSRSGRDGWRPRLTQLCLLVASSVAVLNLAYACNGTFTSLRDYSFASHILGGNPDTSSRGNRFSSNVLGYIPVPLPYDYVVGVDFQQACFDSSVPSYLRGEWRSGGWWYYYVYALCVKVPLGTVALFLLAAASHIRSAPKACGLDDALILSHSLALLLTVSAQTGMNTNVRYLLGVLPFLFLYISRLAGLLASHSRLWVARCVALLLSATVVSSISVAPHFISYFNEAAGGPLCGATHLLHDNIDMGQDLFFLRDWIDEHPEARPLSLAYLGPIDPHLAGIAYSTTPATIRSGVLQPVPSKSRRAAGWYVISVTLLHGGRGNIVNENGTSTYVSSIDLVDFRRHTAIGRAGYSLVVFYIASSGD